MQHNIIIKREEARPDVLDAKPARRRRPLRCNLYRTNSRGEKTALKARTKRINNGNGSNFTRNFLAKTNQVLFKNGPNVQSFTIKQYSFMKSNDTGL